MTSFIDMIGLDRWAIEDVEALRDVLGELATNGYKVNVPPEDARKYMDWAEEADEHLMMLKEKPDDK